MIALVLLVFALSIIKTKNNETFVDRVKKNQIKVGSETVDEYSQVYYIDGGTKYFITSGKANSTAPSIDKSKIVWIEEKEGNQRLVMYDILMKNVLYLTQVGHAQDYFVKDGKAAWSWSTNDLSEIYYFDGSKIKKISKEYPSILPSFEGSKLAYAQVINSEWRTVEVDLATGQDRIVKSGNVEKAGWPHYREGKLFTDYPDYASWKIGAVAR